MQLTLKQQKGLDIALQRYKDNEKYTVIGGFAGTGKSTLVKFIISALCNEGVDERDVCYATFTGKAAQVLLKKGNKNVSTLHKLLYDSFPQITGGFIRKPKTEIDYKIVVVDEVSMAPKTLIDLLFRHKVHVICLGDPFQLPPVDKDQDNHLLDNPHIFLDEIMRQAAESEIIRLSSQIRNQETFEKFPGQEVQIFDRPQLSTGMMEWANQIIVGTNATRVSLNNQMRDLLGHGGNPEDGDKIICLRNYWDIFSNDGDPLVNGTIGYLQNSFNSFIQVPKWCGEEGTVSTIMGDMIVDDDAYPVLSMDKKMILTGEKSLGWKTAYKMGKSVKYHSLVPLEFTYGYAITGHKSQGSEWEKVLAVEESFPFERTEHARWLYTVVTRASEKLVLLR